MLLELVSEYEAMCKHVADIVDKTGYKMDYVREKLGYSRVGWYKKRKAANFNPKELRELFKLIRVEEMEDKVFGEMLEKSKLSGRLNEKETKALVASIR
ncbi:MAG: hypothetical protein IM613_15775 [Cytophagales bacterium]|nr:hypothetical protein [Cytophagales bacterium]MCA6430891.1 hypothetical protein [Cytophagales bacterium]